MMREHLRVVAVTTLFVLVAALFNPTHDLGDTAVIGSAYLWGESSLRCNSLMGIVWFVDSWELCQHLLVGVSISAALVMAVTKRGAGFVALFFGAAVSVDLRRSIDFDGTAWVGVTHSLFWGVAAWAAVLCTISVQIIFTHPWPRGD